MRLIAAFLAMSFLGGVANAATLDFEGNICNGGMACGQGLNIDQSYGDIAGQIDVIYDRDRSTASIQSLRYWDTGYETLQDVAYGVGNGLSIVLQALPGFDVSLTGFDIAPYLNRSRNTLIQIIDLSTNTLLVDDTYTPLSTDGVTNYSGSWFSTSALQINFGPDDFDVGIDNVTFNAVAEGPAPIPLPTSMPLLLAGVGSLAFMRRRRRT